jgi:hypothetical protein
MGVTIHIIVIIINKIIFTLFFNIFCNSSKILIKSFSNCLLKLLIAETFNEYFAVIAENVKRQLNITSSYFCSFQVLEVQIPSRPMPFSTISKENNVSENKKRGNITCLGVWYRTSSLQMPKTIHKNPVSLSMFFLARYSTSCQVSEACGGGNMNEYVVIYLPFSQHPRIFRGARFRMWGHTKSEKTSQDEISLAVGKLDSKLWRHQN